ncbi:MAG: SDR family oxidoreductase [Anaerolineae bacterium]|nr:SDR family oxidoreductase [Anaerolineae bacterium]
MSGQQGTLLVTGASGNLGRRVVELLLEAGTPPNKIVAATRSPEKLADFAARGVFVRQADFEDLDSLASAFAGVERLLLVSTDAVGEPGRRIKQHQNAVKAAEGAGVKHVVYTGIMNPNAGFPAFVNPDHWGTEEALAASKMGYTSLRENIYTDYLLSTLGRAVASGQLFSAAGDGKTAYITREDCARAAAAALASSFEGRRTVDITGPEAVSQHDVAAVVSAITGQKVTYIPLELEALIQGMVGAGLPRPLAEAFATFDASNAQGQFSAVSNGVEELTGRKPTSVADFLAANKNVLMQGAAAAG